MAKKARQIDEEIVIERFRRLPLAKKREVIDFMDFLTSRKNTQKCLEFDEWALNLAREKGFSHLSEDEITRIVDDFRSS